MNSLAPDPCNVYAVERSFDQLKDTVVEKTKTLARQIAPSVKGRETVASIILARKACAQLEREASQSFPLSFQTHIDRNISSLKLFFFPVYLQQELRDILKADAVSDISPLIQPAISQESKI